jgi:hypothetical protein
MKKNTTKETILSMLNLYIDGWSLDKIGKKFNLDSSTVQYHLNKHEEYLPRDNRHYEYNEFFFDAIDTEQKAYFLGLLFADGCNHTSHNTMAIFLKSSDEHIIREFNEHIQSNKSIMFKERYVNEISGNKIEKVCKSVGIEIYSKHLSNKLTEIGCVKRKSLILQFPKCVPDEHVVHFIRGYYDGDGSLSIQKERYGQIVILGTFDFCNEMSKIIKLKTGISQKVKPKGKENIFKLVIAGSKDTLIVLNWLYDGSTIRLNRKYELFQKLKTEWIQNPPRINQFG